MRYRLEYLIVRAVMLAVRVTPDPVVRACGSLIGLAFYAVDATHRRIAEQNLVSSAGRARAPDNRPRGVHAFRPAADGAVEVQHLVAGRDAGPGGVRRRRPCARRLRARPGRRVRHRPFRILGAAGARSRRAHRAGRRARPPARQSLPQSAARADSTAHRQYGHLPAADDSPRAAHAAGRPRRCRAHRSAHREPRCDRRGFLRTAGGDHAAGAGRYRMVYEPPIEPPREAGADAVREFTQRCTDVLEMYVRRHPELWLWMHRRWRTTGTAAVPVHGMFPSADRDVEPSR